MRLRSRGGHHRHSSSRDRLPSGHSNPRQLQPRLIHTLVYITMESGWQMFTLAVASSAFHPARKHSRRPFPTVRYLIGKDRRGYNDRWLAAATENRGPWTNRYWRRFVGSRTGVWTSDGLRCRM